MTKKCVLITNVKEFVGPPALESLSSAGFSLYVHSPDFVDPAVREAYKDRHSDVTVLTETEPEALLEEAWTLANGLDVLLSNDAYPAIHGAIEHTSVTDLRDTLDALLVFPYRLMQGAVPRFKKQGHGNVIFITSCRTELPMPGGAIPDMARAGANALVASLSIELAPYGIPVNGIAPNFLYSEAYFPKADFIDDPKGRAFIEQVVPAGRLGRPEEAGELVAYLASLRGSFHTGSIIKLSGGWPAAPLRP